jgi:hypothetical protein
MKQCECGSRQFKIRAIWYGEMCVELTEEGGFEVVESDPGDSAFDRSAPVECVECARSISFCEWDEPSGGASEKDS